MNWDYLAGFIDGEGSIIIKPPRVRLYISNTNKSVLEDIKKFVKCGMVYHVKRNNSNWKEQYGWIICYHKEVLNILKELRTRLIIKKELCEKAIKYIENKRWQGDYISKEELEKLKNFPSREIAKKIGVCQYSVLKYLKKYKLM
jgi:hypothetical protein